MRKDALLAIYREYAADPAFDGLKAHDAPKHLVMGRGSLRPIIVLVGEAPGGAEAVHRRPFMGPAGKVLDRLLASCGVAREECFVTNVVKYRPTIGMLNVKNRKPTPAEVEASQPYLLRELDVFGDTPVVVLGGVALHAVRRAKSPISLVSGKIVDGLGHRSYGAVFHPAVAAYEPTMEPLLRQHMQAVMGQLL